MKTGQRRDWDDSMHASGQKPGNGRRNAGVALLLTLVFVVVLSAIVVEYSYEMQVEAAFVTNNLADLEAYVAAKSAIAAGMSLLTADLQEESTTGANTYDSLEDVWAYGVPYQAINDAVFQCTIDDECGKINLNALIDDEGQVNEPVADMLRSLFQARGLDPSVVDVIIDWRDEDDDSQPNGAEEDYYLSLELPYGCKNGPMDSIEELLLMPGITPEVYWGNPDEEQLPLPELLTVRGDRRGRVNLNTAERETLEALCEALMSQPSQADLIIGEREAAGPFVDQAAVERVCPMPPVPPGQDTRDLRGWESEAFRIYGDGLAGETSVRIEAYVARNRRGDQLFQVLDWRVIR